MEHDRRNKSYSRILIQGILAIAIFMTGVIAGQMSGHERGRTAGVREAEMAIDESIKAGSWFAFQDRHVKIIHSVKTDSKGFRQKAKQSADNFDTIVRYRAVQIFGPVAEDNGSDLRF